MRGRRPRCLRCLRGCRLQRHAPGERRPPHLAARLRGHGPRHGPAVVDTAGAGAAGTAVAAADAAGTAAAAVADGIAAGAAGYTGPVPVPVPGGAGTVHRRAARRIAGSAGTARHRRRRIAAAVAAAGSAAPGTADSSPGAGARSSNSPVGEAVPVGSLLAVTWYTGQQQEVLARNVIVLTC